MEPVFNLLHDIVGNGHRAQRHAPMTRKGSAGKYYTVHKAITNEQLDDHRLGRATYAVPLIGTDELASAAVIELDCDHLEGAKRVQQAAAARGVVAFGIATHGSNGHDGSHTWIRFAERVNPEAARALARSVATDAGYPDAEVWPNGENIRLPFGKHRWTGDWGITLLPTGEVFDNNNPDELEAAERAVTLLPLNSAPPTFVKELKKDLPKSEKMRFWVSTPARASLADVKARFNAEHDWPELLEARGGVEHREGWACNCGFVHTHAIQIAITSQDKIVSFSPNCRWAPHRDSGKALDKFGFYVDQWHAGDVVAALKTLNPIQPRRKNSDLGKIPAPPRYTRYTDEQRAAYNAARKEKRHQETRDALDIIYDKACNLEMHDRAHLLFAYLLGLCYERGVLQVAPTNAQISADLDMCERYVQYAFRELEAAGLGKRQGGRNVEGNEAATWTFYRSPSLGCKPHQDAECTLDIYSIDLVLDLRACERAPFAPPHENVYADTLDDWEWSDAAHGADELTALECALAVEPAAEKPSQIFEQVPTPPEPQQNAASAETVLDMDEIDRMVVEIQAVADARTAERDEPRHYWEKHEARVWHEDRPVAPVSPTLSQDRADRRLAQRRARWDRMRPGELDRERSVLRNRLKSHPNDRPWIAPLLCELTERLAAPPPEPTAYTPLPLDDLPLGVPEPGPAGMLGTHWRARSPAPGRRPATAQAVLL